MATTLEGIPADSSHQLTMARHIIQEGLPFLKPLRYDTTSAVNPAAAFWLAISVW